MKDKSYKMQEYIGEIYVSNMHIIIRLYSFRLLVGYVTKINTKYDNF